MTVVPYHTCSYKNVPAVFARVPVRNQRLTIDICREMNMHGIDVDVVQATLDFLFFGRRHVQKQYMHYAIFCAAIVEQHVDCSPKRYTAELLRVLHDLDDAPSFLLFLVQYRDRLPHVVHQYINAISFSSQMLIDAATARNVALGSLVTTTAPVCMPPDTPVRSLLFSRAHYFDRRSMQRDMGTNFRQGMEILCVYCPSTGSGRPMAIIQYTPLEDVSEYTVGDNASVCQAGPLQFFVKLNVAPFDAFVCTLEQRALIELLDVADIRPVHQDGKVVSLESSRACLVRAKKIKDAPTRVLRYSNTELLGTVRPLDTTVAISKGITTMVRTPGELANVSATAAEFDDKISMHRRQIALQAGMQAGMAGVLTVVTHTSADDKQLVADSSVDAKLAVVEFVRFDPMPITALQSHTRLFKTSTTIMVLDGDTRVPCAYIRFVCTKCGACAQMYSAELGELNMPAGISSEDVLDAMDTTQPNGALSDMAVLARYMLHLTDELPQIQCDLPPALRQVLQCNRHDEYACIQIKSLVRMFDHMRIGEDVWITEQDTGTHEELCKQWDLDADTVFVGTHRLTALVTRMPRQPFWWNGVFATLRVYGQQMIVYMVDRDTPQESIRRFALCQNGDDRVIRTSEATLVHIASKVVLRRIPNFDNRFTLRAQPSTSSMCMPTMPRVRSLGLMFVNKILCGERFIVGEEEIVHVMLTEGCA